MEYWLTILPHLTVGSFFFSFHNIKIPTAAQSESRAVPETFTDTIRLCVEDWDASGQWRHQDEIVRSHPVTAAPPSTKKSDMKGWKRSVSTRGRNGAKESVSSSSNPNRSEESTTAQITTLTFFLPPKGLRLRDQLCAHQQCNAICNEVSCSPKVEKCKLEERKQTGRRV